VVTRQQTRSRWQRSAYAGGSGLTATKVLVAINVLVFAVELATGAGSLSLTGAGSGAALQRMGALAPYDVLVAHQYWRMVTVMFLHLDLLHIGFNMWALWVIGPYVEAALGRLKFLVLYLVAGLAASVLILYASPPYALTAGASGAIFGVFGALAIYAFINRKRDVASRAILGNIVFLLILNLAFTFGVGGISWQGHIGGLVGGTALMGGYMLLGRKSPGGRFTSSDIVVTVAALGLIVVLTYAKVQAPTLAALIRWP
jgi:membrane associated rhomboid family serine protease